LLVKTSNSVTTTQQLEKKKTSLEARCKSSQSSLDLAFKNQNILNNKINEALLHIQDLELEIKKRASTMEQAQMTEEDLRTLVTENLLLNEVAQEFEQHLLMS
jgi:hypothetical protein